MFSILYRKLKYFHYCDLFIKKFSKGVMLDSIEHSWAINNYNIVTVTIQSAIQRIARKWYIRLKRNYERVVNLIPVH